MDELRDQIAGLLSTIWFTPSAEHPTKMRSWADEVLALVSEWERTREPTDAEGPRRIVLYEHAATCPHEDVFVNGDIAICETCGQRGVMHHEVADVVMWNGADRSQKDNEFLAWLEKEEASDLATAAEKAVWQWVAEEYRAMLSEHT